MKENSSDLINYRLERAWETLNDARILIASQRWNSSMNRLYYAAYYGVMALLLKHEIKPVTHQGSKISFTEQFIKTQKVEKKYGKLYAQLFTWRQKGDYDDLFDFDESQVVQYVEPVHEFLLLIEAIIKTFPEQVSE